jgi:hypothetical protein
MAKRRRPDRQRFDTKELIPFFSDNWTPAGKAIAALPDDEQRELYLLVEPEVVAAHAAWHRDCTRPCAW